MTHVHLPLTPPHVVWPLPWVWALVLLALLPMLWVYWHRQRARRSGVRFSALASASRTGRTWRVRLRPLLPVLMSVALVALIVAVARPRAAEEVRHEAVEGVAIEMVLDTSSSMLDLDLSPAGTRTTRLEVVKDVFRRFVAGDGTDGAGRPHDAIGMIRFGAYPESVCPLTLDHEALLKGLSDTDIPTDSLGRADAASNLTAIGDGLALAVEHLRNLPGDVVTQGTAAGGGEAHGGDSVRARGSAGPGVATGDRQYQIASRVVILLTDGENNAGIITPEQAGEMAALYGVRVYTVLAGTGRREGWERRPVDDRALRRIAAITGGRFYAARDPAALEQVIHEVDSLERSRVAERRSVHWHELAGPWLLAAIVCLTLHSLLDATWLRRLP